MADGNGQTVLMGVVDPALLVVLQAIARALHFDHAIAARFRPQLDQIRQAGAIASDVRQDALEQQLQVRGGNAVQRLRQQLFVEQAPGDERVMNAELRLEGAPDAVTVVVAVEAGQAGGEQIGAALVEVRAVQVGRRPVERVKERARQRREDRVPAE